ncbi:hypothetical protein PENSPDRAFT_694611 [Peniophora sp. CONT]|nr:hypothetical protein PENSPDRAFT_694611 [Peniophora sp. CONT]
MAATDEIKPSSKTRELLKHQPSTNMPGLGEFASIALGPPVRILLLFVLMSSTIYALLLLKLYFMDKRLLAQEQCLRLRLELASLFTSNDARPKTLAGAVKFVTKVHKACEGIVVSAK